MEEFKKTSYNFLSQFLENRTPSPFYSKIVNTISKASFYENSSNLSNFDHKLYQIHDVPGYLETKTNQSIKRWKINKINTYKGTMIALNSYQDLNDYLNKKFNSNRRSKFRTYKKRLENSFDITYKIYYGEISKCDYEFLFDEFHKMMVTRFEQKQALNRDLERWNIYREIGYPLIQKKEACLFVIYDGEKPISICFNIIYTKIIYAYIRAYDIDYAKFYVGFTDLIQQLQWCFDNEFEVFDMLKGDYEYKSKWTDGDYFFQRHIIYNSKFWSASFIANYKTMKIRLFYNLMNYVKKRNIHLVYRRISRLNSRNHNLIEPANDPGRITIENLETPQTNLNLKTININERTFSFLRKYVYDFLYTNCESKVDIEVSIIIDRPSSYFIKGSKSHQIITITN